MEKFAMVSGIGNIFMFLGKMTISSLTTLIGFLLIQYVPELKNSVDHPAIPLLVVFMIAYTISAIFISVFSTSANAILQCFLVDYDIALQEGREEAKHRPDSLEEFLSICKKEWEPPFILSSLLTRFIRI